VKHSRIAIVLVLMVGTIQLLSSFAVRTNDPAKEIAGMLCRDIDAFSFYIRDSLQPVIRTGREKDLQPAFLVARKYYKRIEWAAEYFAWSTARFINGAPKAEAELPGYMILHPAGLQVMEEHIFPAFDSTSRSMLLGQTENILDKLQVFKSYFSGIPVAGWQILDAAKLEVFRIETLGITGYDNPLSRNSMEECAVALQSLQQALAPYAGNSNTTQELLGGNIAFLLANKDFNHFDRALYIRRYANPLSTAIEQLRRQLDFQGYRYNRLLRQDVFTLFDKDAFNADAYSPFLDQENKIAKAALGKALFTETAFSGNGKISCASCHHPQTAFAENLAKHPDISGTGLISRNVPSLLNTALQPQQFYDQRAETLEQQVNDVIHNPKEMGGRIHSALQDITRSGRYTQLFAAAFPGRPQPDSAAVTEALAAYVRSLVRLNSRFDDYMAGMDTAMSAAEVKGFNLFMGKAGCGACHFMPLFSGVLPPKFITQDAEILGVPEKQGSKNIDADRGLFNTLMSFNYFDSSRLSGFDHAFKTVTVRNTSTTAPYMHNGAFATLEEVMDFYNEGGGAGNGLPVHNQSLSAKKLGLTPVEIKEVIAFMRALDSR